MKINTPLAIPLSCLFLVACDHGTVDPGDNTDVRGGEGKADHQGDDDDDDDDDDGASDLIVDINQLYGGASYSDWLQIYWQWSSSTPVDAHPSFQNDCSLGQIGDVWLLPNPLHEDTVERSCDAPAGTAFFLPVAHATCSTAPNDHLPGFSTLPEGLRRCAWTWAPAENMTVTIDGEEVPNLERYHTETGYYPFEVPTINIYDDQCDWAMGGVGCTSAEPGVTYYAVAAGTAVLIKPLPPGEHTIRMVVDYVDGFHNDLTNIINVVE